jgi:monofunctional biosynthetic peptidoglycan transglycosylase
MGGMSPSDPDNRDPNKGAANEPQPEQGWAFEPVPDQPEPAPVAPPRADYRAPAPEEPYIPMPGERRRPDGFRARDAQRNVDLELGRIKRAKRYGFLLTTLSVLFIAFFLAPVTWVAIYRVIDAPATLLMMQRAAEGETVRHQPIALTRMSPHIVRAVIAAEDARFCAHDGFDVEAIQDAMESNARGGRTRGASTISQQTAKNLFLWPQRSWLRKGLETYFTALIEFMWPKQRIMEHYLNVAEWGDGVFGVEAAARARFGVSAEDLTPLQAARLAAVLPSPNRWRADNPGPYVRRRAASIVDRARVVRNEHMAGCVLALDRPGA